MSAPLQDKVALVTGAGKKTGIGYAIARELAAGGAHLVLADLGRQDPDVPLPTGTTDEMAALAAGLAEEFDVRTLTASLDVTDPDSIGALVTRVQSDFERLDILCNNAGATFGVPNTVVNYDEGAWMRTIDVNLHGVWRMTRACVPLMMGRPCAVVNTASRAGKVPPIFNGAYAVAKAGVIMLTKVLARELAPASIRVNAVCPGQVATDLEAWRFGLEADATGQSVEEREAEMCQTIPLNRIGEPAEVGRLVAFLASDASSYITGQAVNVTGGQLMEL